MNITSTITYFLMTIMMLLPVACGSSWSNSSGGGNGNGNPSGEPNVAFVTNATGQGDLSAWPEAGGLTGLEAADAICNTSAAEAGLAGTFVAWLSDDTDDAACRVLGLTGTAAGLCNGQANPLSNAGPWVRTDGLPFAGTLDLLAIDGPMMPIRLNQFGDEVDAGTSGLYFTATHANGILYTVGAGTCTNWSDNTTGSAWSGTEDYTGFKWTAHGLQTCTSYSRLLCMQAGTGGPLPEGLSGRLVFATNSTGVGNIASWSGAISNGIDAADEVCQNAAAGAGLSNAPAFKAWLSTGIINASDRLLSDGPWVRPDGVKVANSVAGLLDGVLQAPINVTQDGDYISGLDIYAWTGSDDTGQFNTTACSGWTNGTGAASGWIGDVTSAGFSSTEGRWTDNLFLPCNSTNAHLYCFEDIACTVSGTLTDAGGTYIAGEPYTISIYSDSGMTTLVRKYSSILKAVPTDTYSFGISTLPPGTYYFSFTIQGGGIVSPAGGVSLDCNTTVDIDFSS